MNPPDAEPRLLPNMTPRAWYTTALRLPRGRAAAGRGLLSFALHALAFAPVPNRFAILVTTWFLMVFTKLFFVAGFHWMHRRARSERLRGWLRRAVSPRNRGAYIAAGGHSSLLGNLALLFLFFWPIPAVAYLTLRQASPWLWILWMLCIVRDLCTGAIILDYDRPARENFGYNLSWMWEVIFALLTGMVSLFLLGPMLIAVAALGSETAVMLFCTEWVAFLVFLAGIHVAQFTMRMDTTNVDWSGEGENAAPPAA